MPTRVDLLAKPADAHKNGRTTTCKGQAYERLLRISMLTMLPPDKTMLL